MFGDQLRVRNVEQSRTEQNNELINFLERLLAPPAIGFGRARLQVRNLPSHPPMRALALSAPHPIMARSSSMRGSCCEMNGTILFHGHVLQSVMTYPFQPLPLQALGWTSHGSSSTMRALRETPWRSLTFSTSWDRGEPTHELPFVLCRSNEKQKFFCISSDVCATRMTCRCCGVHVCGGVSRKLWPVHLLLDSSRCSLLMRGGATSAGE